MPNPEQLTVKFAGRLIDLLGQQMYGGPVPSVAELVANAWDADAPKVEITIPENLSPNSEIIVKDYGDGMTFEELNEFYLRIGYERRQIRGERTPGNRLVMGRKGIGKLAGFGIAEDIILQSVKDGKMTKFTLNYETLRNAPTANDLPIEHETFQTDEPSGVTVIFKKLKLTRNINIHNFRTSMARRFALSSDTMQIIVNGEQIQKDELDFYFRIPENQGEWVTENIPEFGTIKYWFGFLNHTINDAELRGVSVFARDRVAQFTPFFFNLTGGINGQVGLEYLTGQVVAEALDEADDFIATDRQTVNWQFSKAQILEEWGQKKIKALCAEWKKRKDDQNVNKFRHNYGEYYNRIQALPQQEKEDLIYALDKIAKLDRIDQEDFKVIANSMIAGVERESVKKVIKKINAADDEAAVNLLSAVKEWDIISAVSTAEVVAGKLEIISKFDKLIKDRTPEKSPNVPVDMQTFIKQNSWLLGPEYEQLRETDFHHERGVDKWIEDIIMDVDKEKQFAKQDEREGRRFDLACIKNETQIVVLELMRPGELADYDHATRLYRYVTRIAAGIKDMGSHERFKRMTVFGIMLADGMTEDPTLPEYFQVHRSILEYYSWKGLLHTASSQYKEFFETLRLKAPNDPRIQGIENLQKEMHPATSMSEGVSIVNDAQISNQPSIQTGQTHDGTPVFRDPKQEN